LLGAQQYEWMRIECQRHGWPGVLSSLAGEHRQERRMTAMNAIEVPDCQRTSAAYFRRRIPPVDGVARHFVYCRPVRRASTAYHAQSRRRREPRARCGRLL
jgi:hypothetical protein